MILSASCSILSLDDLNTYVNLLRSCSVERNFLLTPVYRHRYNVQEHYVLQWVGKQLSNKYLSYCRDCEMLCATRVIEYFANSLEGIQSFEITPLSSAVSIIVFHGNYVSRAISEILTTLNNSMTLKSGLEATHGHWNWYHLKVWILFPIHLP